MRREYRTEDNRFLMSDRVYGIIHKARTEKTCIACQKPIKKGEKYVQYNYPFTDDMKFHLACALSDWGGEDGYLGIKIETRSRFGLNQKVIICRHLSDFDREYGGQEDG